MSDSTKSIQSYINKAAPRKYGDHFNIRYISPIDGKRKTVPKTVTGTLKSSEEAKKWVEEYFRDFLEFEFSILNKQKWRESSEWLRILEHYKVDRTKQLRNHRTEFSYLNNWVMPYFLVEKKLNDANLWYRTLLDFEVWLQNDCYIKPTLKHVKGQRISLSTANKIINAYNHFAKWLEKHQYIKKENLRKMECLQEGASGLVTKDIVLTFDDEFRKVVKHFEFSERNYSDGRRNPEHFQTYGDMYYLQWHTGMRTGELLGLSLHMIRTEKHIPSDIKKACANAALKVYGLILLDSQPNDDYLTRDKNKAAARKPLKWRKRISDRFTRIFPICDEEAWQIVLKRAKIQAELFMKNSFGQDKANYLLFSTQKGRLLPQRARYLDVVRYVWESVGMKFKHPHTLRHARSTEWVLKFPEKIYQTILGHKAQAAEAYHHIATKMIREIESDDIVDEILNL